MSKLKVGDEVVILQGTDAANLSWMSAMNNCVGTKCIIMICFKNCYKTSASDYWFVRKWLQKVGSKKICKNQSKFRKELIISIAGDSISSRHRYHDTESNAKYIILLADEIVKQLK